MWAYFSSQYADSDDKKLLVTNILHSGTAVAQWLRCCATNRKVAGSIWSLLLAVVECGRFVVNVLHARSVVFVFRV